MSGIEQELLMVDGVADVNIAPTVSYSEHEPIKTFAHLPSGELLQ